MFTNFYNRMRLKLWLIALLFMGSGLGFEAAASHLAGGDLFYVHLGGLRYRVTLRLYRDCSGINLTNESLVVSEGRCGPTAAGATGAGSAAPARRDTQDIFCARYSSRFQCTSATDPQNPTRPSNFEAVDYVFNVTLPGRRRNWCFYWTSGARPDIGNLGTGSSGNVYIDAILNNQDFDGNNSASFNPIDVPLPYVCVNDPFTYSFNAIEADGDSLSFALEAPMLSCSTRTTYATYSPGVLLDTTPRPPLPIRFGAYTGGTYSPTFPISSFNLVLNPATGRYNGVPFTLFDPKTGSFSFIPRVYTAPANTADGVNKYSMVVRITERRRDVNNPAIWRIVGETQRDILVTVVDCGGNKAPSLPTGFVPPNTNGNVIGRRDSSQLEVQAQTCTYTLATVNFSDSNANSVLKVVYPGFGAPGRLPFPSSLATFRLVGNNTRTPKGFFSITASASDLGKEFSFPVRVEDDNCPVKGIRTVQVKLKIIQGNFANILKPGGIKTQKDTICLGDSTQIEAKVMRPDTTIGGAPITYTYVWNPAPGLSEDTAAIVTVTPPATMRYRFTAYNDKFLGCTDTASVLVVVRSPVTPLIRSFYSSQRQGVTTEAPVDVRLANGSYPLIDSDKCTWYLKRYVQSGDTLALDLDSGVISRQLNPDTLVTLRKPGTYVIRLDVDTRTKSSLRCFASTYDTIVVPEPVYYYPNTFTPNGDSQNDKLVFKVPGDNISLTIFNRYGVAIKDWTRYDNSFDGTGLPAGLYYYLVKDNTKGDVRKSWLEIVK